MNDAALKSDIQDIVVDEVFPHAPETIWKALTTGALDQSLADGADGLRSGRRQSLHLPDDLRGRLGRRHPLRGARDHSEQEIVLLMEGRPRGQCRIRRATGHGRYLHPVQSGGGHARPPCPHRASSCRRTKPLSGAWAKAGRRWSGTSAPSPTSRTDSATRKERERTRWTRTMRQTWRITKDISE